MIGYRLAALAALVVLAPACGGGPHTDREAAPAARSVDAVDTVDTVDNTAPHAVSLADGVDSTALIRLDPDLLRALEAAARDARRDGVRLEVTSGWRSRAHQQRLFDEAVSKYGSEEEARRWVAGPDTSTHVTGDAVDVGPTLAADWLGRHGSTYGLCQTFANEMWHFELATEPGRDCPPQLPDGSARR